MHRSIRVLIVSALSVAGAVAILAAVGAWLLARPTYQAPDADVTRRLVGRWDWSTRLNPCRDSAHTIAFSPDRRLMTITLEYAAKSDSDRISTYDLVKVSRSSLRGAIRGERRRTDAGAPVVWDLVLVGPTEYRWHRADWNRWSYTAAVIRCDAQP